MKQLVFAALLLASVLTYGVFHDRQVSEMTGEIVNSLEGCASHAGLGDWNGACNKALDALYVWDSKRSYVSVSINKSAVGAIEIALENTIESAMLENHESLLEHINTAATLLESVRDGEKIILSEIF